MFFGWSALYRTEAGLGMRYINLVRNLSNWPRYLAHKFLGRGGDPLTFVTRTGIALDVPVRVLHDFKAVFFDECYVRDMPLPLPPGADIVDVGANIGSFAFFAASRFPASRILAFEPESHQLSPARAQRVARDPGHVQAMQTAVAGTSGDVEFFGGDPAGHSTGASIINSGQPGPPVVVAAISLADLFTTYKVERCGLLKLDCEGAEFAILYAAPDWVLQRVDQMVMEVHPIAAEGPGSRRGLEDALRQRGFRTRTSRRFDLLWAWR